MHKSVVFIVGTLQTGGIERSVTDWCLYLTKNTNWKASVICVLKKNGPFLSVLEEQGIQVEECKLHKQGFTWRMRKLLVQLNPHVVHSQVAFSMPWQVLAILMSGKRKIVFTQQNEYQNWNPLVAKLRLKIYFRLFFRFIDHYTCVSQMVRESLCSITGYNESNFAIVPNGVDTERFFPDPIIRTHQRQQMQLPHDLFTIGMVARFNPQKGHRYLLEAASVLKNKNICFKIILVGNGPLEQEFREKVDEFGLSNSIVFYGQTLNVADTLQSFDCFLLPSLWEGMPLALLEAMATGLPVIGTDVAGTRELIDDGVTGLLISPKSVDSIVSAVMKLIQHVELRNLIARNGMEFVKKNFSVATNVRSYLAMYE